MCSSEIDLHHPRRVGLQVEMAGVLRDRRFAPPEEESGGGGVRCGVRWEWDWWVEGIGTS